MILSLREEAATVTSPSSPTASPLTRGALRLLVIEDNPDDLFLVKDMLAEARVGGKAGYELTHADSLAGARQHLSASEFDLVLSDLTLPDSDRIGTFQAVHESAGETPVVILSGLSDQGLAVQAVREGAQDYLVKGEADARVLGRAIRYALERFRYTAPLVSSHERFRETLEESDAATLVLDRAGRVIYANPASRETTRRDPALFLGCALPTDPHAPLQAQITLEDGASGVLQGRLSETLWEGKLGYLATLTRFDVAGEAVPAADAEPVSRFEGLRSSSPLMRKLFTTCERVAPTPASVLLLGETGTGKELLARAIHKRSKRRGRFVAINCAAIPSNLIESELFGHEKGAFTGAGQSKPGLFREAEGGTLLLDEVGNLEMSAQLSLLRTLQERRVRPVGSAQEFAVDVRVIAATSVSLFEAVREGDFREDLLYRLDVIRFEVPPLRSRPEDVLHLFRHFARELGERYEILPPEVGGGFLEGMLAYAWPGNVRQLENFAERLLLTGTSACVSSRDFHDLIRPYAPPAPGSLMGDPAEPTSGGGGPQEVDLALSLTEFVDLQERAYVEALLDSTHGRIQEAAEKAGVNRRTMLRKLKKHGLDKRDFR